MVISCPYYLIPTFRIFFTPRAFFGRFNLPIFPLLSFSGISRNPNCFRLAIIEMPGSLWGYPGILGVRFVL